MYDQTSRRRRRALLAGGALNDVQALVVALGGNSKVTAFYDTRYNVTTVGATATAWDDARGASGYGPQLVGQGATKPAWDNTNKLITFDGSQNSMNSAISSAFDWSLGRALIFIGSMPGSGFPATIGDSGITKYAGMDSELSTIRMVGNTIGSITTPTAVGASRRLAMMSFSTPNFYGAGVFPTQPQLIGFVHHQLGRGKYYVPGAAQSSGSWQLYLGQYAGVFTANVMRAVIVLDHPATGADYTAIRDWAVTNHAIVADNAATRMVFFDGNSLVFGQNSTAGNDYPSRVMAQTGFTTNMDYVNSGTGSRSGTTQVAAFPSRAAPAFAGNHTKKIYVAWELCNDIVAGLTAAQAVANMQACCQAAKAAGATTTVVQTCLPNASFSGGMETIRLAANNLLRALPSGIDVCVDTAAIPQLSDNTNATYYAADHIHLTDAGYLLVATDATYGMAAALTPYI